MKLLHSALVALFPFFPLLNAFALNPLSRVINNREILSRPSASASPDSSPTINDRLMSPVCHLVFPGGGIFLNWQGGVITYLREQGYDLSSCSFTGSSAGSMTATLAAADVDFDQATALALKLASKYQVWDRGEGLQGVLLPMIKEWLETLIPESASDGLDGRLFVMVTPVPFLWKKEKISTFNDRQDMIDCNLASIYLPFFSDGMLWSNFRGLPYIDGNFLSKASQYRPENSKRSNTIFLNWQKDPFFADKGEKDLVATLSPDDIWGLVERGKEYAKLLETKGRFRNIPKKELH